MIHYRSILSIVLALIAVMVVNLGNVAVAKPAKPAKVETYTSQQLTEIQPYANALQEMRDRLPELADLIQKQDWTFTRNFIRGPLGEIRFQMLYLTRNLLPVDQVKARELAKKVADNLVSIDLAAEKQDYKLAVRNYAETVRDLDAFLALVPKA
jgi:photosystem II protein PsbQ